MVDKRSGREADPSLQSNADVKNWWSSTPTPPVHLHVMHSKNSIFTHLNLYGSKANPVPVPTAASAHSSFLILGAAASLQDKVSLLGLSVSAQ